MSVWDPAAVPVVEDVVVVELWLMVVVVEGAALGVLMIDAPVAEVSMVVDVDMAVGMMSGVLVAVGELVR